MVLLASRFRWCGKRNGDGGGDVVRVGVGGLAAALSICCHVVRTWPLLLGANAPEGKYHFGMTRQQMPRSWKVDTTCRLCLTAELHICNCWDKPSGKSPARPHPNPSNDWE
jgi:hypothetical protein